MSDGTKIEWTDATVNAINGCSLVSPGCTNCYAMKQAHRFPIRQGLTTQSKGGMVWTGEVRFHRPALEQVLRWQRPRRIFWNAHGDTFHENAQLDWIDQCFAVMALTPQHTHQVLTKRPERARRYLTDQYRMSRVIQQLAPIMRASLEKGGPRLPNEAFARAMEALEHPLPNVWLGTSVEDQIRADERVPILLETPAAVRWLSMEPLLGPVEDRGCLKYLDWIVAGGESGPGSRPMHPSWVRSIRNQCEAAGVPFHFKQWGDWGLPTPPIRHIDDPAPFSKRASMSIDGRDVRFHQFSDGWALARIGKRQAGRLLDGVDHNGYPAA